MNKQEIELDYKAMLKEQSPRSEIINGTDILTMFCHGLASQSGWWDGVDRTDPNVRGCKIALIHSEVSEALEGMRKGLMDDHLPRRKMEEVELADAIIRICDYAGAMGYSLGDAIYEKLVYNQNRADHKPENRNKAGGKKGMSKFRFSNGTVIKLTKNNNLKVDCSKTDPQDFLSFHDAVKQLMIQHKVIKKINKRQSKALLKMAKEIAELKEGW